MTKGNDILIQIYRKLRNRNSTTGANHKPKCVFKLGGRSVNVKHRKPQKISVRQLLKL